MRISKDMYKIVSGEIIAIAQNEVAPEGSVLWSGYDYEKQMWVFEGKKDTRTIEELRASIELSKTVNK